jgi:acyl carrier protein
MTEMTEITLLDWEAFVGEVALVSRATPDQLRRETRLFRDIELDSLSITELGVFLAADFDVLLLLDEPPESWWDMTLGEIYALCERGGDTGQSDLERGPHGTALPGEPLLVTDRRHQIATDRAPRIKERTT